MNKLRPILKVEIYFVLDEDEEVLKAQAKVIGSTIADAIGENDLPILRIGNMGSIEMTVLHPPKDNDPDKHKHDC